MRKKLTVKKQNTVDDIVKDCIVFMTNYSITKFKNKTFKTLYNKQNLKTLMREHHIDAVIFENSINLGDKKIHYNKKYNSFTQSTEFEFESNIDSFDKKIKDILGSLNWVAQLFHSTDLLLDKKVMKIDAIFSMQSFLVSMRNTIYQIDPIIYTINGDVFVLYEMIHYSTGQPLKYNEIYGRKNDFNIANVDWYQYFKEDKINVQLKISDIIFNNITDFLCKIIKAKVSSHEYSFLHNILVVSNNIKNISNYFLRVLGNNNVEVKLKNINTADDFEYYTEANMGLVTRIDINSFPKAMFSAIVLESLKMNVFLNSIISFDIEDKLSKTINRKVYFELLLNSFDVPIITFNMLQQIKSTTLYTKQFEAVNFKINYLKYLQEKKKSKNATLLNILIFVMTFIGSIGTLEVLENKLCLPFKDSIIFLSIVYLIFGGIWIYFELKE